MQESSERDFQAHGRPLEKVTLFKYLGRVLTEEDDDWPEVVVNLKNVRKSWARLTRILIREGARPRVSGMFFKMLLQAMLLFGSETWLLTPHMERALGSFEHWVARRITGRQPRRKEEGRWDYPPLATDM